MSLSTRSYLLSLTSANTARPPDFRWRIAEAIVSGTASRRIFKNELDDYVTRAIAYLTQLQQCRNDADRDQLAHRNPHLSAAHQLRKSQDKLARGIVEARLLAGSGVEDVAAACKHPLEMIEVYERLFFSVVGKRDQWLYLMVHAIGPKCFYGVTEDDVDVILKKMGLLKGPLMVDLLVRYFTSSGNVPAKLEGLSRVQLEELASLVGAKALVLSMTVPFVKSHRVTRLLHLEREIRTLLQSWPDQTVGDRKANDAPSNLIAEDGRTDNVAPEDSKFQEEASNNQDLKKVESTRQAA